MFTFYKNKRPSLYREPYLEEYFSNVQIPLMVEVLSSEFEEVSGTYLPVVVF